MSAAEYIYCLSAPNLPDQIRYIGRTNNIDTRMRAHNDWPLDCNPRSAWLSYLRSAGKAPVVRVLEKCHDKPDKELKEWSKKRELHWIHAKFDVGEDLVNGNVFWKHDSREDIPVHLRQVWCILHEVITRIDFDLQTQPSDGFLEITRYRTLVAIKAMRDQYNGLQIAPLEWLGKVYS